MTISNNEIREILLETQSYRLTMEVLQERYSDIDARSYQARVAKLRGSMHRKGKINDPDYRPYGNDKKEEESHKEERKIEDNGDTRTFEYKGNKSIQSLEDAVDFFEIDLDQWVVDKWVCNSWDVTMKLKNGKFNQSVETKTNYQVKVWLKQRVPSDEDREALIIDQIDEYMQSRPKSKSFKARIGSGVGVAAIADLHTGARTSKSKGVILSENFDLETIISYLEEVADEINAKNYKHVHLAILGDLIESLSGLNHINSWQSMESDIHHGNVIITCYEILDKYLISRINNLAEIYIVGGNHDRASERNDQDTSGTAAHLVSYMLAMHHKVTYHRLLITRVIDGICYLFTHGHWKFSSRELSEIFFDYGKQGMYNVVLKGHLHTRNQRKKNAANANTEVQVDIEKVNYRSINVASLFTGNFYSESLGFTSSAGMSILEASKNKKNVRHEDIPIGG